MDRRAIADGGDAAKGSKLDGLRAELARKGGGGSGGFFSLSWLPAAPPFPDHDPRTATWGETSMGIFSKQSAARRFAAFVILEPEFDQFIFSVIAYNTVGEAPVTMAHMPIPQVAHHPLRCTNANTPPPLPAVVRM